MKTLIGILATSMLTGGMAMAQVEVSMEQPAAAEDSFTAVMTGEASSIPELAKGPCSEIKLTEIQKSQMKDAFFKYEQSKINLEAQAKLAKLNYMKLVSTPTTDYTTAKTAVQAVADTSSKILSEKLAFRTGVLFQILTADQRVPALKCEMMHKRHHRAKKPGHAVEGSPQVEG